MTERKFTKEETMKALDCCQVNTAKGCEKCPYYDKTDDNLDCITKMCADALDLIKAGE